MDSMYSAEVHVYLRPFSCLSRIPPPIRYRILRLLRNIRCWWKYIPTSPPLQRPLLDIPPKANFNNMSASVSLIGTLPNEIWDRIFSLLTSRKDVSACRLTCRSFKDLGSPYLITTVCFALRMDTLNKLYDIIEHPFFREYVTELVYDTSEYDSRCEDMDAYCHAREDSELEFETLTMIHQARSSLLHRVLRHPIADEQVRRGLQTTIEIDRVPIVHEWHERERNPSRPVPWQR